MSTVSQVIHVHLPLSLLQISADINSVYWSTLHVICYFACCNRVLSLTHLLVMVSSDLVVLLIVCVGINTGSAQQGELCRKAFC